MKTLSTTFAIIFLGLASSQSYASDYDYKPGLWETTTTTEVEGVPTEMAPPPQTEQECIKENDVFFESDEECKYDKTRISANKMQFAVTCTTPQGVAKGKGEANFNGKKASGWFEMAVPQGPNGTIKMKSIFKAKYIGACK